MSGDGQEVPERTVALVHALHCRDELDPAAVAAAARSYRIQLDAAAVEAILRTTTCRICRDRVPAEQPEPPASTTAAAG